MRPECGRKLQEFLERREIFFAKTRRKGDAAYGLVSGFFRDGEHKSVGARHYACRRCSQEGLFCARRALGSHYHIIDRVVFYELEYGVHEVAVHEHVAHANILAAVLIGDLAQGRDLAFVVLERRELDGVVDFHLVGRDVYVIYYGDFINVQRDHLGIDVARELQCVNEGVVRRRGKIGWKQDFFHGRYWVSPLKVTQTAKEVKVVWELLTMTRSRERFEVFRTS